MPVEFLVSALVTLAVVVDPIGLVPSYIAITEGLPDKSRRDVALRACLIAAGDPCRHRLCRRLAACARWRSRCRLSASPAACCCSPSPRKWCSACASPRQSRQAEEAIEERVRNIAAFPLAIPLMAGPGAITATVLLAGRAAGDLARLGILLGAIAVIIAFCFVVFSGSSHRQARRHHRQCRAVAPARRAAGGACRAIRHRRRARGARRLIFTIP